MGVVRREVRGPRKKCDIPKQLQVDWILDRLPLAINTVVATIALANESPSLEKTMSVLRSEATRRLTEDEKAGEVAVINAVKAKKKRRRTDKWCDHHKSCGHSTKECRVLNKANHPYPVFKPIYIISKNSSRFTIPIRIGNSESTRALVDTGADVSCITNKLAALHEMKLENQEICGICVNLLQKAYRYNAPALENFLILKNKNDDDVQTEKQTSSKLGQNWHMRPDIILWQSEQRYAS